MSNVVLSSPKNFAFNQLVQGLDDIRKNFPNTNRTAQLVTVSEVVVEDATGINTFTCDEIFVSVSADNRAVGYFTLFTNKIKDDAKDRLSQTLIVFDLRTVSFTEIGKSETEAIEVQLKGYRQPGKPFIDVAKPPVTRADFEEAVSGSVTDDVEFTLTFRIKL